MPPSLLFLSIFSHPVPSAEHPQLIISLAPRPRQQTPGAAFAVKFFMARANQTKFYQQVFKQFQELAAALPLDAPSWANRSITNLGAEVNQLNIILAVSKNKISICRGRPFDRLYYL